jgi:uncharacterized membrane protein
LWVPEREKIAVGNASAKIVAEDLNQIGKKPWNKPQIQRIALTADFDPSSGHTRAQWEAGLKLLASAERNGRRQVAKASD